MYGRKTPVNQRTSHKRIASSNKKQDEEEVYDEYGSSIPKFRESETKPTKNSQMSTGDKSDRDDSRSSSWSSDEDIESRQSFMSS